jgi:hypothetical protein
MARFSKSPDHMLNSIKSFGKFLLLGVPVSCIISLAVVELTDGDQLFYFPELVNPVIYQKREPLEALFPTPTPDYSREVQGQCYIGAGFKAQFYDMEGNFIAKQQGPYQFGCIKWGYGYLQDGGHLGGLWVADDYVVGPGVIPTSDHVPN